MCNEGSGKKVKRGRSRALGLELSYLLTKVLFHFLLECRFPVVCWVHINRCHVGTVYPEDPPQAERRRHGT